MFHCIEVVVSSLICCVVPDKLGASSGDRLENNISHADSTR